MLSQCSEARPATLKFYAVAGRLLCVDAPDERAAAAVELYFRNWYLAPAPGPPAAGPDATIRLRLGGDPPAIPDGLESFRLNESGRCFTDGHSYHLDIDGSRVNIGGRAAEVWAGEDAGVDSPALVQAFFNAFAGAMRRCGLFELHSAGVVEPSSGKGALVVGVSGSGKSTLTMQLATAGWGYLSDDVLLLSERAGRAEARPLRRVFAATETTVEAAGLGAQAGDLFRQANRKLRFAPQTFFPGGFVESSVPESLFFPVVTHERESRVVGLSRPEALARLLRMCPWACYDRPTAPGYLRALSLLAKQCRAYELRAGTDLLADPANAAGLLAAYAAR